ncbi:MAG TPA: amidohydrolase family protein [Candidatus Acidoferrales bacterium]|nr:amidohydrolase family protein [Candidatus Acidoferrales bacterium]
MRKLDIFTHIWPKAFHEALLKTTGQMKDMHRRSEAVPMMTNLDRRFQVMDMFEGYQQILSLASPPPDVAGERPAWRELARIGSDGMAELCQKYPDRFPSFIASVPMRDPEGAVEEARRAVRDLGACGIQIYSNVAGKALDAPEFRPVFREMERLGKPIWIHPARTAKFPDYQTEQESLYEIWWTFGWPYESSAAQARIVFSKMLDEMPNLKFIIHHAGGMVPFFEGRVGPGWDQLGARTSNVDYRPLLKQLKLPHLEYFKKFFYADTATFGSKSALVCALDFYGIDHVLFASDAPFDPEGGPMYIRETLRVIDSLDISKGDREKLYCRNACKMLGLK